MSSFLLDCFLSYTKNHKLSFSNYVLLTSYRSLIDVALFVEFPVFLFFRIPIFTKLQVPILYLYLPYSLFLPSPSFFSVPYFFFPNNWEFPNFLPSLFPIFTVPIFFPSSLFFSFPIPNFYLPNSQYPQKTAFFPNPSLYAMVVVLCI